MSKKPGYPELVIDMSRLKANIGRLKTVLDDNGIELCAVIKGISGLVPCAQQFELSGCGQIASSRLEHFEAMREAGIQTDFMMLRIPMISESEDVVRLCEYSLNSEIQTLRELNRQAGLQDRLHKVILMADLGDLREGFWHKEELIDAALLVENNLHNLKLAGIGTNLGCYGSIVPTEKKMRDLVDVAESIEEKIGRELEIISGGASTSFFRVLDKDMPRRINHLRIGEIILAPKKYGDIYGYDLGFLAPDAFKVRAEVIEVRYKPSYPDGEIKYDAFGHRSEYEDLGIRRRALLAIGAYDYANFRELTPRMKGVKVIGASSDHTILDVDEAEFPVKIGDVIEMDINYEALIHLTNSPNVKKVYI